MDLRDESDLESRPDSANLGGEGMRIVALIAAVVGAVGSVGLMLWVRSRAPLFLIILFLGWVLLPFAGLVAANFISKRWSVPTRTALYIVTLFISVISLILYAKTVLDPPASTPAFIWLVVPGVSWIAMLTIIPAAALISRKRRT